MRGQKRRGVCEDFVPLQMASLRPMGLPDRYVSGYLKTQPPMGTPRMLGANTSHAWASFYAHGLG
ncbi:MAG: transglutaminase family protein [Pedosphaera sp.]|nr:transglutaminase family protein [Pedosphaera sp.]